MEVNMSRRIKKTKSPADSLNYRQGHSTQVIAHLSPTNSIVGQSQMKGKAHDDVSQLRNRMQEIWKESKRITTLSLLTMRQEILCRKTSRHNVPAD